MKRASILFAFVTMSVTSGFCASAGDPSVEKLLVNTWTWVDVANNTAKVRFTADGIVHHPSFSAKWIATSPSDFTVIGTTGGLKGKEAKLHFDKDFKHFDGTDFNGSSAIHGEVTDAEPSLKPSLPKGGVITAGDLQRILAGHSWTWMRPGSGKELISFDGNGNATHSSGWIAKYAGQDTHSVMLEHAKARKHMKITFTADYSSYSGTDFDGNPVTGDYCISGATPR